MIFEGSKQRLLGGSATPQSKAADAMIIEVDFAAHQAMRPLGAYSKVLAEQVRLSGFTGAADEDHPPLERCVQVKLEVLRQRQGRRGGVGSGLCSGGGGGGGAGR